MSVLGIDVAADGVGAVVVAPDRRVLGRGHHRVATHAPQADWAEQAPEDLWQATLAAVRSALADLDPATVTALGITGPPDTVVLWDDETLGAPRRAIAAADRRTTAGGSATATARLAWITEHEPHTWALVESGRYAVGPVVSYLLARMTRGTFHVLDAVSAEHAGGDWSPERCASLGVPEESLPEVVAGGVLATTEPRTFLGLALPVTGLGPSDLAGPGPLGAAALAAG